jgi:light-regulated signal transduction histidine kinase (bacteriophytochrome)
MLNILEDFAEERARLADTQHAVLNILEDAGTEQGKLEAAQRAALNILEDFAEERGRLAEVQRAMLNILEDFDEQKASVEQVNREMAVEIVERRRAEQALEVANKELEAFSYSVSHDLRAPLRAIDGFSLALLEDYGDRLDEDARGYLERVRAGTQRMGRLIDDLLGLSRVARVELRRERVNLSALAESVVEEIRRSEPERDVVIDVEQGLGAVGDPHLLRIVLTNLLGNSWKFTAHAPRPRIEFGAASEGMSEREYFVRDNGAGFDMAYAGKLFGAFQRLHTQGEYPGTGIGLATVQRIVHRHGGRVYANAAPGEGATFFFTLPDQDQ